MIYTSGKQELLKGIINSGLLLHLYNNNVDLKEVESASEFIQPLGFKQRFLYSTFWDVEKETAYIEEDLFFDTAVGEVYGYFITVNNHLLWAERFKDAPLVIANRGDKIKFDITLVMKECL